MAKTITSIYIQDSSIDLLVMKDQVVDRWASMPLEPDLVNQGQIVNEEQVSSKITALLKLESVSTKRIIVGLSGLNSVFRIATLPELPDAILAEAVRHEASRMLPVSIDEVYLTYQRIPSAVGETRVFLAATPRSMIDSIIKTVKGAGLDPYLIDLAPLALSRIPDQPRSIIIDAKSDHLGIIIMSERLPQVIRSLPLASDTDDYSENITAISEELNRTITFYNSMHLEAPLDDTVPIYVGSELVNYQEAWPELLGRLENPVELLPLQIEFADGFNPSDFLVNIGLVFKELIAVKEDSNVSIINMNILPQKLQPTPVPWAKIVVPVGAVIAIGALAYLGLVLLQNATDRTVELNTEIGTTTRSISQTEEAIETLGSQIEQTETAIQPLEGIASVFDNTFIVINAERDDMNGDVSPVVSLAKGEVMLTNIQHDGFVAYVDGFSSDEDSIFRYARYLRGSGRYSRADIEYVMQDFEEENDEKRFQFVVRLQN
jgi:type IV pilus assembly protein PilM